MTHCRVLLGTFVEISIGDSDGISPALAKEAFAESYRAIALVDQLMNIHQENSELSRIIKLAHLRPIKIHPWLKEVLLIANDLYLQSNGLFNPSYNPYLDVPTCSLENIDWSNQDHIYFERAAQINLNGIAKGYAVDKAIEALENYGVQNGLVNAGGDLRIFGDESAQIYIRNPLNPLLANPLGDLQNVAVASSGNYFQNHLFNPQRQSTIRTDSSFTVIAKRCVYADGLTKVLASLGHSNHPCFRHYQSLGLVIKG